MASNSTEAAQRPQQPEYQDCILCRLTGTAVFGMLSLGAFKEAWRLHREGGQGSSAPATAAESSLQGSSSATSRGQGARATIARLVKAMEVFPAAAETSAEAPSVGPSHPVPPKAAPTRATPSATPASSSLRNVKGPPTARVAFLVLAGIGFGGGAVWRAVMPANKAVPSSQAEPNDQTSYGSRQG